MYDFDYADDDRNATRGRDDYFKEAICSDADRNGSGRSEQKISTRQFFKSVSVGFWTCTGLDLPTAFWWTKVTMKRTITHNVLNIRSGC